MVAIRSEHDTQNRRIQAQKVALDGVISDLGAVNLMGKDKETVASDMASPTPMAVLEGDGLEAGMENSGDGSHGDTNLGEDGEEKVLLDSGSTSLNVAAKSFVPGQIKGGEDDIEMGEVEEEHTFKGKKKARDEELEEGEASDSSSELSDPPDD